MAINVVSEYYLQHTVMINQSPITQTNQNRPIDKTSKAEDRTAQETMRDVQQATSYAEILG
jgi:hypothetical protein